MCIQEEGVRKELGKEEADSSHTEGPEGSTQTKAGLGQVKN